METPPKPRSHKALHLLIGLAVVVMVSVLGYLYWKQLDHFKTQKADLTSKQQSLEKDLTEARSQATLLKSEKTDLEKQIEQLKNPVRLPLGITVQAAQHFGANYFMDGNDFVLIPVTIKNTSNRENYLTLSEFKLKDSQNRVYPLYSQSAVGGQPRFTTGVEGLPSGHVELRSQTVAAGETVTGTLIFYTPTSASQFKLTYGGQSFDIQAK